MSRIKSVYKVGEGESGPPFRAKADSACRVETECGTVYWFSRPDEDGVRDVVREPAAGGKSCTMIVQRPTRHPRNQEISERFRGELRTDVQVGMSLALEVTGEKSRILSEVVVKIEPGDIPEDLFT